MYEVIRAFKDNKDNDRLYQVGDTYPASGKANKKRVEELLTGSNRNGKVYIREAADGIDEDQNEQEQ